MTTIRLAAATLAAALCAAPAVAEEYATYEFLEVTAPGDPACRIGMLATLPASWKSEDGAAVLLSTGPAIDPDRDLLVSALISEHAAVLELLPRPCAAMSRGQGAVIGAALGALEAMKRTLGAGLVVAIGYGPGSNALLDVVAEPAAGLLGPDGPRYTAAVALRDGAPAFALGAPAAGSEQAPQRLALLCHMLAGVAGGTGAAQQPTDPAGAATACRATLASGTSPGGFALRPSPGR